MALPFDPPRRTLLAAAAAAAVLGHADPGRTQPGPFPMLQHVDAGVLRVTYAEAGPPDGPAILLLHGWPYDIQSFAEVAPMLAADTVALMDALGIGRAVLAGFDWGARTACIVAALWPERCRALVSVSGYLVGSQDAGRAPLPPGAELAWWYQFYFATPRSQSGYDANRREFARLIWHTASPRWNFDDATFARSAAAFDNPDHVAVVVHNYRWRMGLADGEPRFNELERRLAGFPSIAVPAITLEGDANGAPHPEPASYAAKFTGPYAHRLVPGGIGHNLPQEAPRAFAQAVVDAAAS